MPPEPVVGRRVASVSEIERPGDYCRTSVQAKDELQDCVFFIPRDDGSLEVRASIGCVRTPNVDPPGEGYIWHGYLDEGHRWRTA